MRSATSAPPLKSEWFSVTRAGDVALTQHAMSPISKLDLQDLWWEHSISGLAIVSRDGTIEEVNPQFARMLGFTVGELRGKKFTEVTHPGDVAEDMKMVEQVLTGQHPGYEMHKRYLHKMGQSVWARLKVVAIKNQDGTFHAFFSQTVPAHVFVASADEQTAQRMNTAPVVPPFVRWLAENAKWLVPVIITGLGFLGAVLAKALEILSAKAA